jgi:hypothetical protein
MALSVTTEMQDAFELCVAQLSTNAESLTDPFGTFVETMFPEVLRAKQHQTVYGRRGVGKTHLLRRIEVGLRESFERDRCLPVYLNGSQLSQEVALVSSDPALVALAVYVQAMQQLASRLHEFITHLNETTFWDRTFSSKKAQVASRADQLASLLRNTLTSGQVRMLPKGVVSDESATLAETSKSASAGLSAKLSDPRTLGWAVSGSIEGSSRRTISESTSRRINGEVILPFKQVAAYIFDLLSLLGGASLVILFDEWSDVDKDLNVQPYLAEMLRRTSAAVPSMYLKLACIPGRTVLATPVSTSSKTVLGLEEGDDIHSDVDLDSIVFATESLQQIAPFFIAIVKKHVGTRLPWVNTSTYADFDLFMTTKVFEGPPSFVELCQASGAIPRDFMNIYRKATSAHANLAKADPSVAPIGLLQVRQASRAVYQSKRASFGKAAAPQLRLLDSIYRRIYVGKSSYFFLLSEIRAEDDLIQTLYMEKLIQECRPLTTTQSRINATSTSSLTTGPRLIASSQVLRTMLAPATSQAYGRS